jgi:hypothetical protein
LASITEGQFYKSTLPSSDFNTSLEKIVSDFKYNYKNITGDTLSRQPESEVFESLIKIPGATNCVIYKFHSAKDTTASWQAVMFQGDDYREAVKIYRNTFRLVNKSKLQLIDRSVTGFSGELEEPKEAVGFAVSTLQLDITDYRYNNFKAEVELLLSYSGYQVNLNLHNKKPDTEMN